ncbi:MAG: DUF6206 family protein [Candidatus Helarchaeota archaeon]
MKINRELIKELEYTIDTIHPEKGKVPIKILGFGEISLVFELLDDEQNIAYKRLPIFDSEKQVRRHVKAYKEYNRILKEDIGINIPDYDTYWLKNPKGIITLYCAQKKVNPASVGNKIIHELSKKDVNKLIELVMRECKKIWQFNKDNKELDVGFDGQISNFALEGYDPETPTIPDDAKLLYLDTSTPMYRKNGIEAMEAELFLKSAPFFLKWLLKALFLQEVLDRYYDWRLVTIDLVANFFKEQESKLIPSLIKTINNFFSKEANEFKISNITLKEVSQYYKSDKQIWEIFQFTRRIDRYIKVNLLRKQYDFYLLEKIKR